MAKKNQDQDTQDNLQQQEEAQNMQEENTQEAQDASVLPDGLPLADKPQPFDVENIDNPHEQPIRETQEQAVAQDEQRNGEEAQPAQEPSGLPPEHESRFREIVREELHKLRKLLKEEFVPKVQ